MKTFIDLKSDSQINENPDLNVRYSSECGEEIPAKMSDLTGGLKKYFYKFDSSATANLEVLGYGGGALEKKELLLIVDFVQHKEIKCSNNEKRTYGVGARLFLRIIKKKKRTSLTLPKLAASVELDRAEVNYTISTIGITGSKILDALPTGSSFDVENYAKVINSVDNIIRLAKDNEEGVIIEPQLLPDSSTVPLEN